MIEGDATQLKTNNAYTGIRMNEAFRHHGEIQAYLNAANVVPDASTGVRTGTLADKVFFSINVGSGGYDVCRQPAR